MCVWVCQRVNQSWVINSNVCYVRVKQSWVCSVTRQGHALLPWERRSGSCPAAMGTESVNEAAGFEDAMVPPQSTKG